ncbi:hypothetical protein OCU04_002793 [Sclerotinia nivalis]|uniref:Uncharacterized protein n=1 Tax=Sclerotinia nivalis TaxID=352851 RepID=A0A9X0AUD8_9HELO|nr:hypothetical protein OCU04_002793 [Sclerotinia nivalis]
MTQSYDIPSHLKSTSAKMPQSGGHPSRGRSMSPATAKSTDRPYRSRSPPRAISPSGGRLSPPGSKVISRFAHLQNSPQDIESRWIGLNASISSESTTRHQTRGLPLTTLSPSNAFFSTTPPEPAPLSEKEHRELVYENLLKENLRRKSINDKALEKARTKLDNAFDTYIEVEVDFRRSTRVANRRVRDTQRWHRTRKSFADNEAFTARYERMRDHRDKAKRRHDIALTRWLTADLAASASNNAVNSTRADSDAAWEALVGTGGGAGSTDGSTDG